MPLLSNIYLKLRYLKTASNNVNSCYVNDKESYKATWTVDLVHLLVLALLVALVCSTNEKVFWRSESEIMVCICKVLK